MEDVGYGREIVYADPSSASVAFHMAGVGAGLLPYALLYIVCDGFHLSVRVAFTDDEVIRRGIVQFAHIEFYDAFTFDVLNTFYDKVIQFLGREWLWLYFSV